jgi:hypothetical protein
MPRGDKNKRGTSGQGSSNQSDQPFIGSGKHQKSNHNKRQTGGWPSDAEVPQRTTDEDRNRSDNPEEALKSLNTAPRKFDVLVDKIPYLVTATPFTFNGEIRYKVKFNGSPEYTFTWDSEIGQLRAIDDDSSTLPENLEMAISQKLQS